MTMNENGSAPLRPGGETVKPRPSSAVRPECDDRADHRRAPGVGSRRGPRVPHAGGPVLGIEVPAHAPDRHRRDDHRRERQPDLEAAAERRRQRVTGRAQANREPHARLEPRSKRAPGPVRGAGSVRRVQHALPSRPLDRASRATDEQPDRDDHEIGERERHDDVAGDRNQRREDAKGRLDRSPCGSRESRTAPRGRLQSTRDRARPDRAPPPAASRRSLRAVPGDRDRYPR